MNLSSLPVSEIMGALGIILGAYFTLLGTRRTAAVNKKEADVKSWEALTKTLQAEVERLGKGQEDHDRALDEQSKRIASLEQEKLYMSAYIRDLRDHIKQGKPPPPPADERGLYL